jgi:hypothetical protein
MKQFPYVSGKYGAPMGRSSVMLDEDVKVHLFRVKMVDGDYDDGGAYWGGYPSEPLYCARDDAGDFLQFHRAPSRDAAKADLQEQYPNLRFYR